MQIQPSRTHTFCHGSTSGTLHRLAFISWRLKLSQNWNTDPKISFCPRLQKLHLIGWLLIWNLIFIFKLKWLEGIFEHLHFSIFHFSWLDSESCKLSVIFSSSHCCISRVCLQYVYFFSYEVVRVSLNFSKNCGLGARQLSKWWMSSRFNCYQYLNWIIKKRGMQWE